MSSNNQITYTVKFPGLSILLFLVFLILKLTGAITWSWLWVTSPLWISFGLVVSIIATVAIFALMVFLVALGAVGIISLIEWLTDR